VTSLNSSLVDEEREMTEPVGPSPEGAFDYLANQLAHFVPVNKWFASAEDKSVIVQVFRVYKDASGSRSAFPTAFLIQDFDALRVRAVFTRANFLYIDADSKREFPTPDGEIEEQFEEVWTIPEDNEEFVRSADRWMWRSTKEGTFLLLITPLIMGVSDGTHQEASLEVVQNQILARAAIITAMGRNAAFERLFEIQLRFYDDGTKGMGYSKQRSDDPAEFDPPRLDGPSAEKAVEFIEALLALDEATKNRVSLALRWYLRTQRHAIPANEWAIDTFINYWIAFEALAMPRENLKSAIAKLAAIHGRSEDEIQRIFPIKRIFGLRGKILHHGLVFALDNRLLQFMDDMFVDVLLYILDIPSPLKTSAYLDGSVKRFLPEMQ
jgi:Apea-like HEPN